MRAHGKMIKKWVDNPNLTVMVRGNGGNWINVSDPSWDPNFEYKLVGNQKTYIDFIHDYHWGIGFEVSVNIERDKPLFSCDVRTPIVDKFLSGELSLKLSDEKAFSEIKEDIIKFTCMRILFRKYGAIKGDDLSWHFDDKDNQEEFEKELKKYNLNI